MLRNFRKPLVIAAPKIGLKHPMAVSSIAELTSGVFQPVLASSNDGADTVVLCSGKIAFDLEKVLFGEGGQPNANVKLVRLEELAPFPTAQVQQQLASASKVIWAQEESSNQGAFQFAKLHVNAMGHELHFIGRPSLHSFTVGSPELHKKEVAELTRRLQEL